MRMLANRVGKKDRHSMFVSISTRHAAKTDDRARCRQVVFENATLKEGTGTSVRAGVKVCQCKSAHRTEQRARTSTATRCATETPTIEFHERSAWMHGTPLAGSDPRLLEVKRRWRHFFDRGFAVEKHGPEMQHSIRVLLCTNHRIAMEGARVVEDLIIKATTFQISTCIIKVHRGRRVTGHYHRHLRDASAKAPCAQDKKDRRGRKSGRRTTQLPVLGEAHAANIIVEDDRGRLKKGRAEDPFLHPWCTENGQPTLVTSKAKIHSRLREVERLTEDLEAQMGRVLAAVEAPVRAIFGLFDRNAIKVIEQSLDLVRRSANEVGTGIGNSVFDLVAIEFGRDPPEGMIRVLVRPSDGTGELEKVDPANVQRSFASRTKGELIGARLDEVLLFGGPSKRKLLDVKGAVFGIGEG